MLKWFNVMLLRLEDSKKKRTAYNNWELVLEDQPQPTQILIHLLVGDLAKTYANCFST
jgi:hypothetical protein